MPFDMLPVYDRMRLIFSNPISVVLTRPASYSGGALESITVPNVQEQAAEESSLDSPMGGSLGGERRAFRMWLIELGESPLVPHQGYLVTKADGSVWVIDSVDVLCKGRSFRLHATRRPS